MQITDEALDQAFQEHRKATGGVRDDYFGVLYLQKEHGLTRAQALAQVSFGGNDHGIDGYHFDRDRRNFYFFQFKYTESYQAFKGSFQRLIDDGVQRVFDADSQESKPDKMIQQIKATLLENQAIVERVYFHFVFLGEPQVAEQSKVLADQRETLENKKHLIDDFLDRQVTMAIEFKSARSGAVASTHVRKTRIYELNVTGQLARDGPDKERMLVGFVRLMELNAIFADLRWQFFERNIRAALAPEESVNVALKTAIRRIAEGRDPAEVFAFNHNGVTMSAEAVEIQGEQWKVTTPRLLNGAQTVATFNRFLEDNKGNRAVMDRKSTLNDIRVQCRIITKASDQFITTVTINNNRQNPVEPWNLRANDRIQLELADLFIEQVQLLYARHENLLESLTEEDLGTLGVQGGKAIEIYRLGQTFAVADGEVDKLSRMRDVFEDDRLYEQLFSQSRKKNDMRKVVLAYKAGLYAGRLVRQVQEMGSNKYDFVRGARNMLWALTVQGMLNDPRIEQRAEQWGRSLSMEMDFRQWLLDIARTNVRLILSDVIEDKAYREKTEEGNYSFLKSSAAFKRAMELAYKRYKWEKRDLT